VGVTGVSILGSGHLVAQALSGGLLRVRLDVTVESKVVSMCHERPIDEICGEGTYRAALSAVPVTASLVCCRVDFWLSGVIFSCASVVQVSDRNYEVGSRGECDALSLISLRPMSDMLMVCVEVIGVKVS
jgi:hypothetical protein